MLNLEYIDDKTNRIKDLISFGQQQDYFYIDFRLTTRCNYACYYCIDMHNNYNKIYDFNLDNLRLLVRLLLKNEKVPYFFIYGGEPTLHSQLFKIIKVLGQELYNIGMIEVQSNLSLDKNYIKKLCKIGSKYSNFILSGSYHNNNNFNLFLEKCLLIKQYKCLGKITFMYNSKNNILDEFYKTFYLLGRGHVEISPLISGNVIEDPIDGQNSPFYEIEYIYEHENIDKFSNHSYFFQKVIPYKIKDNNETFYTSRAEIWYNKANNFIDMNCMVNKERLIINYDGQIYSCFNDMFNSLTSVFNEYERPRSYCHLNDPTMNEEKFDYYLKHRFDCDIKCLYRKCFFELEHQKFINNV
jgi:MoaA/NifB/PqqE/SkfB family radical SAM enzyme